MLIKEVLVTNTLTHANEHRHTHICQCTYANIYPTKLIWNCLFLETDSDYLLSALRGGILKGEAKTSLTQVAGKNKNIASFFYVLFIFSEVYLL